MSSSDNKSVNIGIPPTTNGGTYHHHSQSTTSHNPNAPPSNWVRNGTSPLTNGLGEKEQLALSDLLTNNFTASFWNFRTRFERLLLFVVFIVSILCVVLLVLMVFLLLNTSLIKGTIFETFFKKMLSLVSILSSRFKETEHMYPSEEHFILLKGPWTM